MKLWAKCIDQDDDEIILVVKDMTNEEVVIQHLHSTYPIKEVLEIQNKQFYNERNIQSINAMFKKYYFARHRNNKHISGTLFT